MNWNNPVTNSFGNAYAIATQWLMKLDETGNPISDGLGSFVHEERIVVGGTNYINGKLKVNRYLPNGTIDNSFGNNGVATHDGAAYPLAITIQPSDQKILTTGDTAGFARLNANGSLDMIYGSSTPKTENYRTIAVLPNGKFIVGGYANTKSSDFIIRGFNIDGTPDDGSRYDSTRTDAFGVAGKVITDFYGKADTVNHVIVNSNANNQITIIAAGSAENSTGQNMAFARYSATGQLIAKTFVNTGGSSYARSVQVQSNGKIVLFGSSIGATTFRDFAVARVDAAGIIEKITMDFSGGNDDGYGAIQTIPSCTDNCERFIMAGSARDNANGLGNGNGYAAVARFLP
jgi:uncharacterized delta-60 repeat protein